MNSKHKNTVLFIMMALSLFGLTLSSAQPAQAAVSYTTLVFGGRLNNEADNRIINTDVNSNALQSFIQTSGLTDIEIDPINEKIYWTGGSNLYRANLDGSNQENVGALITNGSTFGQLSFDQLNETMYITGRFASTGTTNHIIALYVPDDSFYSFQLSVATGFSDMAVDPINGVVYWSASSMLYKQNINGTGFATITPSGLNLLSTLAFDPVQELLFVRARDATNSPNGIYTYNVNTANFTNIIDSADANAQHMRIDGDAGKVYWTLSGSLYSANTDGSGLTAVSLNNSITSFFNQLAVGYVLSQSKATISFAESSSTEAETVGTDVVTVNLVIENGPMNGTFGASLGYTNTSVDGNDYTGDATVSFNCTSGCATGTYMVDVVTIINDNKAENNETLGIQLSNPTGGASLGTNTSHTLTIQSEDVNQAPVATADSYDAVANVELVIEEADGVLFNDTDTNGDTLTAVLDTTTSDGTLDLSADGSFTYDPDENFTGEDSFTYHANDGNADSSIVTVTITVTLPPVTLISPTGTLTEFIGNATYVWTDIAGATSYNLYVYKGNNINTAVVNRLIETPDCNGSECSLDIVSAFGNAFWLTNGSYTAWMRSNPGGTWAEAGSFTVEAPAAAPITIGDPTNTHTLQPTLNWTLVDTAANASWFRLYVAPYEKQGSAVMNLWVRRDATCGGYAGTICSYTLPENLVTANETYILWTQSWAPAGLTGWAGSASFQIGPSALEDLALDALIGGVPNLSWTGSDGVTSYQVWIGTLGPAVAAHFKSYTAAEVNCDSGSSCTLTPDITLTPGTYKWYVRGSGPAGYTLGGWQTGPDIVVPSG